MIIDKWTLYLIHRALKIQYGGAGNRIRHKTSITTSLKRNDQPKSFWKKQVPI